MEESGQRQGYGRLEDIQAKINWLRRESRDVNFTAYLIQMQGELDKQVMNAEHLSREIDRNYQIYLQFQQQMWMQPMPTEVQPMPSQAPVPVSVPIQPTSCRPAPKKKNVEFQIGAGMFCVVGVLFVLAAFIMLGMNYMDGMIKGISLYVISIGVILLSELFLRRRMEKMSLAITGLGIGGLYTSTIINYSYLHNFNEYVAMAITLVVAVLTILFTRRKDSGVVRLVSFIGCNLCALPVITGGANVEFLTVAGMLLVVNVISLCLPVARASQTVHIIHMITNVFMSFLVIVLGVKHLDPRMILGYIGCNLLVQGLLFYCLERKKERISPINCSVYCITLFFISLSYIGTIAVVARTLPVCWFYMMMGMYALTALILFLVFIKSSLKWIQYYATVFTVLLGFWAVRGEDSGVLALLAIFLLSKLLGRVKALKVSEIVITAVTAVTAWGYFLTAFLVRGMSWHSHALAAGFFFSILALYHYKPLYQGIITAVLSIYLAAQFHFVQLCPIINIGALFLLLLLFNYASWWRGKHQRVYNYCNLGVMIFWSLAAGFVSNSLNGILLFVLGTAVVVFTFQPRFYMDFKAKYLFLALFWTYVTLISGVDQALAISCILMVIAIAGVAIGFALKKRDVRIYGLILSLLVCLKVVFYDYMDTPMPEKILLFLVVGVIILAISGIYIVLEKKVNVANK